MAKKNPLKDGLQTHAQITAHMERLQRKIRFGKLTTEEGKVDHAAVKKIELELELLTKARMNLDSRKKYGEKLKNPADLGTPKPVQRPSEGPFGLKLVEGGGKE